MNTWIAKSFQIRENQPRFSTIPGEPECGRCRMCFVKLTIIVNRVSRTCTWESECWQMKFRVCTYDDVVPWFEHSSIKSVKIQWNCYSIAHFDGKKIVTRRENGRNLGLQRRLFMSYLEWKKNNFHTRAYLVQRGAEERTYCWSTTIRAWRSLSKYSGIDSLSIRLNIYKSRFTERATKENRATLTKSYLENNKFGREVCALLRTNHQKTIIDEQSTIVVGQVMDFIGVDMWCTAWRQTSGVRD